jgi:hypothetical protein
MSRIKNPGVDPNEWLLPETAAQFVVVGWNFGPLIHHPGYAHLGHPGGRVNLRDLKPAYAGQLVDAGFPYLRRKSAAANTISESEIQPAEAKGRGNHKKA